VAVVNLENSMMTLRLSAETRQKLHRLEQTLILSLVQLFEAAHCVNTCAPAPPSSRLKSGVRNIHHLHLASSFAPARNYFCRTVFLTLRSNHGCPADIGRLKGRSR